MVYLRFKTNRGRQIKVAAQNARMAEENAKLWLDELEFIREISHINTKKSYTPDILVASNIETVYYTVLENSRVDGDRFPKKFRFVGNAKAEAVYIIEDFAQNKKNYDSRWKDKDTFALVYSIQFRYNKEREKYEMIDGCEYCDEFVTETVAEFKERKEQKNADL